MGRLAGAASLEPLARVGAGLFVAVTPEGLSSMGMVLRAAAEMGVPVGLWPMTDDGRGRWLAAATVGAFERHLQHTWDAVDRAGVRPARMVFDLEPPIAVTRAAMRGRPGPMLRSAVGGPWREGRERIHGMVRETLGRGVEPVAAVAPPVLLDPVHGPRPVQRLLGTPVDGLPFARVHVMLYSSLLEGYVPGVGRGAASRMLAIACRRARRRFGPRAAVSLGLSGGGALGDERPLRSAAELAEDALIARREGIDELALHGLAGALERGLDRWLDALIA